VRWQVDSYESGWDPLDERAPLAFEPGAAGTETWVLTCHDRGQRCRFRVVGPIVEGSPGPRLAHKPLARTRRGLAYRRLEDTRQYWVAGGLICGAALEHKALTTVMVEARGPRASDGAPMFIEGTFRRRAERTRFTLPGHALPCRLDRFVIRFVGAHLP
jgi:hypothetical protein